MFKKILKNFSTSYGLDLGSETTLMYEKDKGVIINEPSVVALNQRTDQIIAVGHNAKRMIGKTPEYILTSRPLSHGIISDYEVSEKMIKHFIEKLQHDSFSLFARPRIIIGVPLEITEVEKKAVEDAAFASGASEVFLVQSIIASAIGSRLPINEPSGSMMINIGGGVTEIGVLSLHGVVNWKSLPIAGRELDKNIQNYARENFNLLLGERVAESIKIKIGSTEDTGQDLQIEMRGRDLISGLPREIIVNEAQIRESIMNSIRTIVENVKITLENTPPELVADIYERGMVLAGGTSLLQGIDQTIAKATQIPVRIADDPLTCTIRGLGILLEDDELLQNVKVPLSSEEYKTM